MALKQKELDDWKVNSKFPLMFFKTSTGKTRVWACWVVEDCVFYTDGFVDGKLKEPQRHQYAGNTLRTGAEQAPLEAEKMWLKRFNQDYHPAPDDKYGQKIYQHVKAQKEANGGMNRGVKLFGKSEIITTTTAGKKKLDSRHRPMLAKKYKDWKTVNGEEQFELTNPGKAIKFPALVQAKVDGIRAIPHLQNGKVSLESRNGNNFVHLNHLREEIKYWLEKKGCEDLILDGEMYVHQLYRDDDGKPTFEYQPEAIDPEDLNEWFEDKTQLIAEARKRGCKNAQRMHKVELRDFLEGYIREFKGVERYQFISEACKITRTSPHPYEEVVEFWIFDIWDPTKTNEERYSLLQDLFSDYDGDILKLVPSKVVNNHQEIESFMTRTVGEDTERESYEFEGIMVRQLGAKYAPSTTHQSCLLKYKRFEDEEWEVCGAEPCVGSYQDGAIKWVCKRVVKGKERQIVAKQMGDTEENVRLYKSFSKNPKPYLGRMMNIRFNERTKDGIPRFPRATTFVEDK